MSEKLNHYFTEMDRLLALDSKYKRPGYTMDMNDYAYLYTLAVYSLLMLKKLGIQADAQLELPALMSKKVLPHYLYDMEYCGDGDDDGENNIGYDYYAVRWREMYEPYKGCFSRKNAYYELSDFMYRLFQDIRKKHNLGLWTIFSEEDCAELCSSEFFSGTGIPGKDSLSLAAAYFMHSCDGMHKLPSMGIQISKEIENEMIFDIDNTLFIQGIFAMTSAKTEKILNALENRNIHDECSKKFLDKCGGLDKLLWRPGVTIMADYTNSYKNTARTQIIGTDGNYQVSFDYAEISPLLPVYLHYLEKAAEAVDGIYFDGKILGEDADGKQKRED